mmetsp:Transcript_85055/g.203855  ORF Transcript_85055/g.203855 Transcript_85055/m.203855 type:complete len:217 (+) Transcript_85055:1469-2119(+)
MIDAPVEIAITKHGSLNQQDHGEEIALQAPTYSPGGVLLEASDLVTHSRAPQRASGNDSKGQGRTDVRSFVDLGAQYDSSRQRQGHGLEQVRRSSTHIGNVLADRIQVIYRMHRPQCFCHLLLYLLSDFQLLGRDVLGILHLIDLKVWVDELFGCNRLLVLFSVAVQIVQLLLHLHDLILVHVIVHLPRDLLSHEISTDVRPLGEDAAPHADVERD